MQRDDAPTLAEIVGRALLSGDLRQKEHSCDLDKVGALGLVGVTERLADAVFRLKYAGQPSAYDEALYGVYVIARSLASRNRWKVRRWRLWRMARSVLDYWLSDLCRACNGVRYLVIPGSPHLSDRPCPECKATGKRAMPWLRKLPRRPDGKRATPERIARWRHLCNELQKRAERHRHLLVELERAESRIADKVAAKLGR
jgi:hypothetical protein